MVNVNIQWMGKNDKTAENFQTYFHSSLFNNSLETLCHRIMIYCHFSLIALFLVINLVVLCSSYVKGLSWNNSPPTSWKLLLEPLARGQTGFTKSVFRKFKLSSNQSFYIILVCAWPLCVVSCHGELCFTAIPYIQSCAY